MRKFCIVITTGACVLALGGLAWGQASLDITVDAGGTDVVVYSGAAQVCDLSGRCEVVEAGCGAASVSGDTIDLLDDAAKVDFIAENFPLVLDQAVLREDFRVDAAGCGPLPQVPLFIEISPFEPGAINEPTVGSPG